MSNETKIGILAVVAIAISLWGYKFIMGTNMLATSNVFYVEYDNIEQLQKSNPILVNGLQIGVVKDMYLKPDDPEYVIVELDVDKDIQVPKNAVASIISTGAMGGKAVTLSFDKACSGIDCAQNGDFLQGQTVGLIRSLIGSPEEVNDYTKVLKEDLGDMVDTLTTRLSENEQLGQSMKDLQIIIANLKTTTYSLNRLMATTSQELDGVLKNMNSITGTIEASNKELETILKNTSTFTDQLTKLEMEKTLREAEVAMQSLKTTLETADKAMVEVNGLMSKVNNGNGTLGKLVQDEELYHRLSSASIQADSLLTDLRQKPYRYMPLKSRKKVKRHDEKDKQEAAASGGGKE